MKDREDYWMILIVRWQAQERKRKRERNQPRDETEENCYIKWERKEREKIVYWWVSVQTKEIKWTMWVGQRTDERENRKWGVKNESDQDFSLVSWLIKQSKQ